MSTIPQEQPQQRKTRVESLNDRINQSTSLLNSLDAHPDNYNTTNLNRMQKILEELTQLKASLNDNPPQNEIDDEVNQLPERAMITLSVSKIKTLNENLLLTEKQKQSEEYIKSLESQVVKQRLELEQLKKIDNAQVAQVSTLEDQIRILKSKAFGYDIAKKFDYYKDKELKQSQMGHVEDENLAYAMWEKENYDNRRNPTRLDQMQNQKQMWISNAGGNIDRLVNGIDASNKKVQGITGTGNSVNVNVNASVSMSNRQGDLSTNMRKNSQAILSNNNMRNGKGAM